jgi:hypothetical protein
MPYDYPEDWERDETNLWAQISGGHQDDDGNWMRGDDTAIALFDAGWLQEGYSREEREAIRDAFFDYAIEEGFFDDREEFDWQAWREYMDY